MAWAHSTQYRHYIQKYKQGSTTFLKVDIEQQFQCRFVEMAGADAQSVKSVYTEDYNDHNGLRVWSSDTPVYKGGDISITLRWRSDECGDVIAKSDAFFEYISGKKLEYSDTFRNKYFELICTAEPTIKAENLKGVIKYRFITYKFTNFGGKPFKTSQLI